jgi:hypothetical protein
MYVSEPERLLTFRGLGYAGFRRRRLGPISVLVTEWSFRKEAAIRNRIHDFIEKLETTRF